MTNGTADRKDHTASLPEHIRFAPDSGHIQLFDQRMLLMHGFSLGELRRELVERLGIEQTRDLFSRLGYQQGLEDHARCRDAFGASGDLMVAFGRRLRDIEGFVRTRPIALEVDLEAGHFWGEFIWSDSWEANAHIQHLGIGGMPACWMNIGYACGYGTALFGRPLLFREVECIALGHKQCRVIGKPLSEWDDLGDDAGFLRSQGFVDLPSLRGVTGEDTDEDNRLSGLVGASAPFNAVIYLLRRVADTDATVLFLGESGVGKEQFAHTLHRIGPRADKPFISVNCAGIPADLVEAELFGVEKGAYTGATASRPGRFERADGGTLFLDEIGSLPHAAQGKLLRALQDGEIERVGDTQMRKLDVRIVAATNEDLRQAVADRTFRDDLFYRLNVFPVEIPPLRERREDIPLLLNVFIERFAARFNKRVQGVSRNALDALWAYEWPGNVRELENMVERAVILLDDGEAIDQHHLFSGGERLGGTLLSVSPMGRLVAGKTEPPGSSTDPGKDPSELAERLLASTNSLEEIESLLLDHALARHDGNISAAARALGLGRGQMQYRLDKRRRSGTQAE